jgi:bis(5'-nucleosyl)-tetraphosphatase (symmetrical)
MSVYWVGDIQGCDAPLGQMLDHVGFSVSRDRLYVLGDLVNRGPSSLAVLRRLHEMGSSVQCVLGNHDLHLLALAKGARSPSKSDTLQEVLEAPDRNNLLNWLQHQSLALFEENVLMVHAGVLPQWSLSETLALARELENILQGDGATEFLINMYGNEPAQWQSDLQGMDLWRCALNAFTRIRFCSPSGHMEFKTKEGSAKAPAGFMPWFEVPGRQTADITIAFGHWSTLGAVDRNDIWALDTGCVWGGCLTALQRDHLSDPPRRIEIKCPSYQTPF